MHTFTNSCTRFPPRRSLHPTSNGRHDVEPQTRAYKFHANILAVNHTIHEEAEEVLYKWNIFVIVDCHLPTLSLALGRFDWAPLVSVKRERKMKHHSLHIHIDLDAGSIQERAKRSGMNGKKFWCMLLIEDLHAFCQVLRTPMANIDGARVIFRLNRYADGLLKTWMRNDKLKPPTIDFEFWNTKIHEANRTLRNQLLAPFSVLRCPNLRLSGSDCICDKQEIEDLQDIISPSTLSSRALAWNSYQAFADLKDLADEAKGEGEVYFARGLLSLIKEGLESTFTFQRRVTYTLALARKSLYLETLISLGLIEMSLRDLDSLFETRTCVAEKLEELDQSICEWPRSFGALALQGSLFLMTTNLHSNG